MLRVLALETSTLVAGVALWEAGPTPGSGRLLGEVEVQSRPNHADVLMRQVETLLSLTDLTLADLQGVAVGAGPGSFTGLRIAYATAKGLCYASGAPLLAVPSLLALAQAAASYRGPVVAALDARRGEVFAAEHQASGSRTPLLPSGPAETGGAYAAAPASLGARLRELAREAGAPVLGLGSGFEVYRALLQETAGDDLVWLDHPVAPPARWVARLAAERLRLGQVEDLANAAPLYIRPADAIVSSRPL
jgi:tRNA threonylcarbamoyladenosine biosynthesis protein TsaB